MAKVHDFVNPRKISILDILFRRYDRAPFPVKNFSRIVLQRTGDQEKYLAARSLMDLIHEEVKYIDFFYETQQETYKAKYEASKAKVYSTADSLFGGQLSAEMRTLDDQLILFFPYERDLWDRVKSGYAPTNDEIEEYSRFRGSDAKYYASIVQAFSGEDFTLPMHASMQLIDLTRDIWQYREDMASGLPNVVAMYLSQIFRQSKHFPEWPHPGLLKRQATKIFDQAMAFDYKNCEFLKKEMGMLMHSIRHPEDQYPVQVR